MIDGSAARRRARGGWGARGGTARAAKGGGKGCTASARARPSRGARPRCCSSCTRGAARRARGGAGARGESRCVHEASAQGRPGGGAAAPPAFPRDGHTPRGRQAGLRRALGGGARWAICAAVAGRAHDGACRAPCRVFSAPTVGDASRDVPPRSGSVRGRRPGGRRRVVRSRSSFLAEDFHGRFTERARARPRLARPGYTAAFATRRAGDVAPEAAASRRAARARARARCDGARPRAPGTESCLRLTRGRSWTDARRFARRAASPRRPCISRSESAAAASSRAARARPARARLQPRRAAARLGGRHAGAPAAARRRRRSWARPPRPLARPAGA